MFVYIASIYFKSYLSSIFVCLSLSVCFMWTCVTSIVVHWYLWAPIFVDSVKETFIRGQLCLAGYLWIFTNWRLIYSHRSTSPLFRAFTVRSQCAHCAFIWALRSAPFALTVLSQSVHLGFIVHLAFTPFILFLFIFIRNSKIKGSVFASHSRMRKETVRKGGRKLILHIKHHFHKNLSMEHFRCTNIYLVLKIFGFIY